MTEKKCASCNRMIIKDWEKWLLENKQQVYVQCCFCWHMEKIDIE